LTKKADRNSAAAVAQKLDAVGAFVINYGGKCLFTFLQFIYSAVTDSRHGASVRMPHRYSEESEESAL
jgi:hypothetical protein